MTRPRAVGAVLDLVKRALLLDARLVLERDLERLVVARPRDAETATSFEAASGGSSAFGWRGCIDSGDSRVRQPLPPCAAIMMRLGLDRLLQVHAPLTAPPGQPRVPYSASICAASSAAFCAPK